MESIFSFVLIILAGAVVINLLLTVSLIRNMTKLNALLTRRPELTVGMPAPNFQATTLFGETVTLADYKTKALILVFVAFERPNCCEKVAFLEYMSARLKSERDIELVLVSESNPAKTALFINSLKMKMSVIVTSRVRSDFARVYNPSSENFPYYILDHQRIIRGRGSLIQEDQTVIEQKWTA